MAGLIASPYLRPIASAGAVSLPLATKSLLLHNQANWDVVSRPYPPLSAMIRATHPLPFTKANRIDRSPVSFDVQMVWSLHMRARSDTGLGTPAQQKIKFKKFSACYTNGL